MTPKATGKKEYSMEIIETAENLYIYGNKTYEEISRILDVPVITLQRWGADEKTEKGGKGGYGWRREKLGHLKRRVEYRRTLYELRDKKLKDATENTDPQILYGLGTIQKLIDAEEKLKPFKELPEDPGKTAGLSDETLARIKEEIYGIQTNAKPKAEN